MTTYLFNVARSYLSSYSGLSRSCWRGLSLCFAEATLIGIYYFLPLYFVNDLQMDIAIAGILISFYGIGTILGGFLGGKLSDAWSPSLVSIGSLLTQAFAFLALLSTHQISVIGFVLCIMGVASYAFITSNHLWVLNQCHDQESRMKALSLLSVASNFGLGLSAVLIGALADYGFHFILSISSICLFLAAFYSMCIDNSNTQISHLAQASMVDEYHEPQKISTLVLVFTLLFCVGFIIFQASTTYSIYIQDAFPELGIKAVSFLFLLNCMLVILFQAPITSLIMNINKILLIGVGASLIGMSMFLLPFSMMFSLAIFSMIMHTLGEILFFSPAQYVCYQSASPERRGHSLGLYRMIYAASRVAAPALGGLIYQHFGGDVLWYLCGIIGVAALLVVLSGWRKKGIYAAISPN